MGFAQSSQTSVSAEAKHAADTLQAGAIALETSRLALQKATDPNVKRFAGFEAAEQETMRSVLKNASRQEAPKLDNEGKAMVETLAGMPAGKSFDAAYVKGQIDGHNKLLGIQESYLSSGKDGTHRSIAALARGHIKEHLANLEVLEKAVR
jgi:putative membrane protein